MYFEGVLANASTKLAFTLSPSMHKFLRRSLFLSLSSLLVFAFSCSKKQEVTPAAAPTNAAVAVPVRISALTQAWFAGLRNSAGSRTTSAPPAINWERATYSENYVVAPFADTLNPLGGVRKYGYRFLVVRMAPDSSCTGRIVELIVDQSPATPARATRLALNGVKPLMTGQEPGSLDDFTGYLLAYSPTYEYQTGLVYTAGALEKVTGAINIVPQDICYQYYLYATDNQGGVVFIQNLWNTCDGGIPSTGGGGDGGSTGGGGWGGTTTGGTGPAQTATIAHAQLLPCQNAVLQELLSMNSGHALSIIELFSGDDPDFNWVVKNGHNEPGQMGSTSLHFNFPNRSVISTFDGWQMSSSTNLLLATTFMHEAIHAYLISYYSSTLTGNNTGGFPAQYPQIAFMYSTQNSMGVSSSHHDEMAYQAPAGAPSNGWIGDIAWSLKQYGIQHGYNLGDTFYMDLAWAGLEGTSAFANLPFADRKRIRDTIDREALGLNHDGTPALSGQVKGSQACVN